MTETQLLILVTGAVLAIAIVGLTIYFIAKGNWAAAVKIAEATRADIPVLDKIEAAATGVVPVKFVLDMITALAPAIPTINADQERFKQVAIDILKNVSDGKPNLPPEVPAV